ncbi:hypothetical protein ACHAXA_000048 [Cyclostephanos tholiformis]|uniref:J domain-containing protein n=1 Tax=Cyclostephanos tholiformis TaxID=382380 RepID=A0ABD3SQU7_9STRA
MTTYYDILGVSRCADQTAIRKAYLKSSLRCHPDKNPGREEEARMEFVEVGMAYSVLGDVDRRAAYDRELSLGGKSGRNDGDDDDDIGGSRRPRGGGVRSRTQTTTRTRASSTTPYDDDDGRRRDDHDRAKYVDGTFDDFMRMFDETVSGMSEEELTMAMGAAAMVGSVIGSILGARTVGGGGGGGGGVGNALLSTTASVVGSALASRAAGSLVMAVHEDSKQRVLERKEREAAIARGGGGARVPTSCEGRERVFRDAGRAFQRAAGAAMSGTGTGGVGSRNNGGVGMARNADGGGGRFSWAQAAELVLEGVRVCAEMQQQQQGGGGGSNSTRRQRNPR